VSSDSMALSPINNSIQQNSSETSNLAKLLSLMTAVQNLDYYLYLGNETQDADTDKVKKAIRDLNGIMEKLKPEQLTSKQQSTTISYNVPPAPSHLIVRQQPVLDYRKKLTVVTGTSKIGKTSYVASNLKDESQCWLTANNAQQLQTQVVKFLQAMGVNNFEVNNPIDIKNAFQKFQLENPSVVIVITGFGNLQAIREYRAVETSMIVVSNSYSCEKSDEKIITLQPLTEDEAVALITQFEGGLDRDQAKTIAAALHYHPWLISQYCKDTESKGLALINISGSKQKLTISTLKKELAKLWSQQLQTLHNSIGSDNFFGNVEKSDITPIEVLKNIATLSEKSESIEPSTIVSNLNSDVKNQVNKLAKSGFIMLDTDRNIEPSPNSMSSFIIKHFGASNSNTANCSNN
jgi:hypothetical protein